MHSLKKFGIFLLLVFAIVLLWLYQTSNDKRNLEIVMPKIIIKENKKNVINIASVVCGGKERAKYVLPLLKSAILFSETNINFHLFTSITIRNELKLIYSNFTESIKRRVKIKFYNPWFPMKDYHYWKNLYKNCASQKIFLPILLTDINELIYFDSDMIISTKVEKIWKKFKEFSTVQVLGASNDCGGPECAYYNPKSHIKVVGRFGINSGLLFMKLDELRRINFVKKIIEILNKSKYAFDGEQDMINILFHNRTHRLKQLDCSYNYFPHVYCNDIDECEIKDEIKVIHGAMSQFEYNTHSLVYSLAHKLIDIDLNRNKNEAIKEIINHVDNYDNIDKCIVIKHLVFKDFRNDNYSIIVNNFINNSK